MKCVQYRCDLCNNLITNSVMISTEAGDFHEECVKKRLHMIISNSRRTLTFSILLLSNLKNPITKGNRRKRNDPVSHQSKRGSC